MREAGVDSEIFYGNCTPDMADQGHPLVDLGRPAKDRWLLYQSSIGSPVYDILAARSEPKLVNYHNITPARLLERVGAGGGLRGDASAGPSSSALAAESRLAVADSAFNETRAGRGRLQAHRRVSRC